MLPVKSLYLDCLDFTDLSILQHNEACWCMLIQNPPRNTLSIVKGNKSWCWKVHQVNLEHKSIIFVLLYTNRKAPCHKENNGIFPKWRRTFTDNVINHWTMNLAKYKDRLSHWHFGSILVSYTRGNRFKPFYCNDKFFCHRSRRIQGNIRETPLEFS